MAGNQDLTLSVTGEEHGHEITDVHGESNQTHVFVCELAC